MPKTFNVRGRNITLSDKFLRTFEETMKMPVHEGDLFCSLNKDKFTDRYTDEQIAKMMEERIMDDLRDYNTYPGDDF